MEDKETGTSTAELILASSRFLSRDDVEVEGALGTGGNKGSAPPQQNAKPGSSRQSERKLYAEQVKSVADLPFGSSPAASSRIQVSVSVAPRRPASPNVASIGSNHSNYKQLTCQSFDSRQSITSPPVARTIMGS